MGKKLLGQKSDGEGLSATEGGSVGEGVGDGNSRAVKHRLLRKREDLLGLRGRFLRPSVCSQSEEALEKSSVEEMAAK
jgi:hypothetical protein